jgi:hypothetical protein
LIPDGVGKGDLVSSNIQWLRILISLRREGLLLGCRLRLLRWWWGRRRGGRCGDLLCVQRADLELGLIFLENTIIVVLPELLAGVLARDTAEDLLAAWQKADVSSLEQEKREAERLGQKLTWVLVLEFGQVVDILVDDDVQVVGLVMRLDVAGGEGFRHGAVEGRVIKAQCYMSDERQRQRARKASRTRLIWSVSRGRMQ